jgi:hypothetical protein
MNVIKNGIDPSAQKLRSSIPFYSAFLSVDNRGLFAPSYARPGIRTEG